MDGFKNEKETIVGEFKSYYPNGKLKNTGKYDNGFPDGFWVNYQENGNEAAKGNWKAGVQVGEWKHFNENGKLQLIINYDLQGNLHGNYFEYDDEGNLCIEGSYISGLMNGKWVYTYHKILKIELTIEKSEIIYFKRHENSGTGFSLMKEGSFKGLLMDSIRRNLFIDFALRVSQQHRDKAHISQTKKTYQLFFTR